MWRTIRRGLTASAVVGGLYFLVVAPAERMWSSSQTAVVQGLQQVLGALTHTDTRVIEGRAEIIAQAKVSELSLLEMRLNTTRTLEKSENLSILPLGTKKITIRGNYTVKAGYRLKEGVSLRMEKGTPIARFPKPEIISVELIDFEVINEDGGWLNKIRPADRAQILRELRQQTRSEAIQSGVLQTVESTLQARLEALLGVELVRIEHTLP